MERQLTKKRIFGETSDKGGFWEIQSIDKGGTFRETIDKGALSERPFIRGHFKRDNRSTREALSERLNKTGRSLLSVLLLFVNHFTPSHILY